MEELKKINTEKRQPLEVECYDFLKNEGFRLLPYWYARSKEEMENIIAELEGDELNRNRKYVMKVMSTMILHKTDFNAVKLNIALPDFMATFEELFEKFQPFDIRGLLIVPMASDGIELLIGSTTDPTFGLITLFGIGGTLVEVLNDVTFGKAPLTLDDARLMIRSIESQQLLQGPRGLPKLDTAEMADFLVRFSKMTCEHKEFIKEIDLNPVRITNQGIMPLDARIIFHPCEC